MQLIFQYDLDRLISYSTNADNNIKIVNDDSCVMLSFPGVNYFNYVFNPGDQPFSMYQIENIKEFYYGQEIDRHKVIVDVNCKNGNAVLRKDNDYKHVKTIVKTAFSSMKAYKPPLMDDLSFIKVDDEYINLFTDLYLKGFEAHGRDHIMVADNLRNMLNVENMDLFVVKHNDNYVGVNVLYNTATESLLAEGAILHEYRNKGFHKGSLAFRIQQVLNCNHSKNIVAWAYKHTISLQNMLKLKMEIQQEFNVYEYCK